MLLPCVIFALLTFGVVMPCVIDIATTPGHYFDLPTKQTWLVVVVAFWVFGAAAWLLVGRRDVLAQARWDDAADDWMYGSRSAPDYPPAYASGPEFGVGGRHGRPVMATSSRFIAPDDNPEFLLELEQRIRGWREDA